MSTLAITIIAVFFGTAAICAWAGIAVSNLRGDPVRRLAKFKGAKEASLVTAPRLASRSLTTSSSCSRRLSTVWLAPAAERSDRFGEELRFLLEQAWEAEVHDVEIETGNLRRSERAGFRSAFERLRLEHGFPRSYAGRG